LRGTSKKAHEAGHRGKGKGGWSIQGRKKHKNNWQKRGFAPLGEPTEQSKRGAATRGKMWKKKDKIRNDHRLKATATLKNTTDESMGYRGQGRNNQPTKREGGGGGKKSPQSEGASRMLGVESEGRNLTQQVP